MERYFVCFNEAGYGTGRRPGPNETLEMYARDCLEEFQEEPIKKIPLDDITGWPAVNILNALQHNQNVDMTFFAEVEVPPGTTGIDAEDGPIFDDARSEIVFL